eukprot:Nitzschia sp. Nitz4//scaffold71_size96697//29386//32241//NITZ4_004690-RA/size96697-processed-gene-0.108-mRNA-1//1//CDS//3329557232//1877//frame0
MSLPHIFALVSLLLGSRAIHASPVVSHNVWTMQGPEGEKHSQLVQVDQAALTNVISTGMATNGKVSLTFDFFDGPVECVLGQSSVMHPNLAAKYPQIISLSGNCQDGGTSVSLSYNTETLGSFSATVHHKAGLMFFVDHDDELSTDPSVFYLHLPRVGGSNEDADVALEPPLEFVRNLVEDEQKRASVMFAPWQHRQLATLEAWKFRLAIVTTATYSAIFGSTRASVMTEINKAMARVNGVMLRELGVMFELIADTDDLICLNGESDCDSFPEDSAIWDSTPAWTVSRGVAASDYDLGHHFTTSPGGVAYVASLCRDDYDTLKLKGNSGYWGGVYGDEHYMRVAHEIGHQLSGRHTFRDCRGPGYSSQTNSTAVEPGSGSSILSYAGRCGSYNNNIQIVRDPYYNSHVLVTMRQFVEDRASAYSCGTSVPMTGVVQPMMSTQATCTVPRGNYVQLGGSIQNAASITGDTFIAWDRVDPGYEDYADLNVARFAPLTPSPRSLLRFLPNMYVLSFNPTQQVEIEPKDGYGDQTMTFRFIGRTKYHDTDTYSSFDIANAGTFGYTDMDLTYDDDLTPLSWSSPPATLTGNDVVTFTWSGGTGANVELLVALNTMTEVASPDFDEVVEDLDFVSMGVFPNTGSASATVPQMTNPSNLPMNLMIRSGSSECYFFDLAADIAYTPGVVGPTGMPSAMPSLSPSTDPSSQPSGLPSLAPSSAPSTKPSSQPSMVPSATPSAAPSDVPSLSPSESPSDEPSSMPSNRPSTSGSAAPSVSSAPTGEPSSTPSTQPSAVPSLAPSPIPSATPSSEPSAMPSESPSSMPSDSPSSAPSSSPSVAPSDVPSSEPSSSPRRSVSMSPTTASPSSVPSESPSSNPSGSPTVTASSAPSVSAAPTVSDTKATKATKAPKASATLLPTNSPTASPSAAGTPASPSPVATKDTKAPTTTTKAPKLRRG